MYLPGKVVSHARQMFLRIPSTFREEVELMKTGWAGNLEAALATPGANAKLNSRKPALRLTRAYLRFKALSLQGGPPG